MASTHQDLSDLADLVLTKLRESDGEEVEDLQVVIYAESNPRHPIDGSVTVLKRVRVDGTLLWRLQNQKQRFYAPGAKKPPLAPELPAVKNPRTAIRLALGRMYTACGTAGGNFLVQMFVETASILSHVFREEATKENDCRLVLKQELEMARILQEMEAVRVVLTGEEGEEEDEE